MGSRLDDVELWLPGSRRRSFADGLAMVWIIATSVFTFIVVRFVAAATKITGTKIAREAGDDVIVLIVVEEH